VSFGHVGILTVDLHLPDGSSLKTKRKELHRVKAALTRRFACAVAEVDHHDLWQRTAIAVAAVGGEQYHLRKVMHEIERFVERQPRVEVIDAGLTLHYPEDG
jgi:hypothetical protein